MNRGLPSIEYITAVALGEMELARGNAERALVNLSEVAAAGLRPGDPLSRLYTVPSYAEASIRAGQPDLAASAAASFGHWAATTRSAPDLALHARLPALLAPADAADPRRPGLAGPAQPGPVGRLTPAAVTTQKRVRRPPPADR